MDPFAEQAQRVSKSAIHSAYQVYLRSNPDPITGAGFDMDVMRSRQAAHAFERHGGNVEPWQLRRRATFGTKPDRTPGRIPRYASAFTSDALLRFADLYIRSSGSLEQAILSAICIAATVIFWLNQ